MNKTLRPYQIQGAEFLAINPHALLADQPGLGKTLQAIHACELVKAQNNLVLCPASVRKNWRQEIFECTGSTRGWDIMSYNQAPQYAQFGLKKAWDAIIFDEAHYLKSIDSQRTQAVFGNSRGLARRARYKWALTGTPVLNRPRELYPLLKTLAQEKIAPYDNFTRFAQRYCGAFFDGYGLNTRGASNVDDLAKRLRGFMLRRTKKEVAPELPARIISRIPLDVSCADMRPIQEEEHHIQNRESFLSTTHENFAQLGDLARLLRLTGEAKVPAVGRFCDDLLNTVDKIVVFGWHKEVIAQLHETFGWLGHKPVTYGGTDMQKQAAIDQFVHTSGCRVFLGNIRTAGTGINGLQEVCSDAVFAELSWVPSEMGQAVDRLHRIGMGDMPVNAYVTHIPGTLESAVLGTHDSKIPVIDRLMGGGGIDV